MSTSYVLGKKVGNILLPVGFGHFLEDDESRLPSPRPLLPWFPRPRDLSPRDLPDTLDPADGHLALTWLLPRLRNLSRDPERPRVPPAEPLELDLELTLDELREFGCDEAGAAAFLSASEHL